MNQNELLINLEGISFNYPGGPPVVDHLDFHFYRGERIGLIAPNGSGKTTLLHLIMGLLKPSAGRIEIFGKRLKEEKDFAEVRRRIGLLFQDADDQLFSPTVLEDVAFGPLNLGKSKEQAVEIARRTLNFLGLSGFDEVCPDLTTGLHSNSRAEKKDWYHWRRFWPWSLKSCCSMNRSMGWIRKPEINLPKSCRTLIFRIF